MEQQQNKRGRGRPAKGTIIDSDSSRLSMELNREERRKLDIILKVTGRTISTTFKRLLNQEFARVSALAIASKEQKSGNYNGQNQDTDFLNNLSQYYDFTELNKYLETAFDDLENVDIMR